ncbi:hypothetical protein GCM10009850_092530 [Nonomuraea monospora]|uniref:Solute-binding protein family 3/N-terminal domain-containing protein n=1 Tax=Nonomuraea monospora TaxID=568818 RepID=A0ABP5PQ61_9ACTN
MARRTKRVRARLTVIGVLILVVLLVTVSALAVVRSIAPSKQDLLVRAGLQGKARLTIGVRDDLPGIALCAVTCAGFDIDIAYAVARELGFPPGKVDLVPIEIEHRDDRQAKKDGGYITVDLVVASYSITEQRIKEGVRFSSAYLETTQAVLTRSDFDGTLESMAALRGKKVCTLGASTAEGPLRELGIIPMGRFRISDCVRLLKAGEYDAVQSDAAILAGFVAQDPDALRIHDITLDPAERWGIHTGPNEAMHTLVELALHRITTSGEWRNLYAEHLAPAELVLGQRQQVAIADPPTVPRPEIREW